MSPSSMFRKLQAPLLNIQWSWGAIRPDGRVILRVWGDETRKIEDRRFVRLANHKVFSGASSNGYNERVRHIAAIKSGAEAYAVMCNAVDPNAEPREIKSFDERTLIRLGEIRDIDGDEWAEMRGRIDVRSFLAQAGN